MNLPPETLLPQPDPEPASADGTDLMPRFVPRAGPSLLLWLILGFFAVFIIWASLTEIDRTVRGMGRVVPSSKMQVISNLEGGIVQEVLVRTGQQVRAGDSLVRLDPHPNRRRVRQRHRDGGGACGKDRAPDRRSDWQGTNLPCKRRTCRDRARSVWRADGRAFQPSGCRRSTNFGGSPRGCRG